MTIGCKEAQDAYLKMAGAGLVQEKLGRSAASARAWRSICAAVLAVAVLGLSTAEAGARIAVHIGEIVDNNDFSPWIRLSAPNGVSLGNTWGTSAAAIEAVAPASGTYLVLVASNDSGLDGTGTYRLTMAHTPGPITVSPGDEGGPLV